MSWKKGNKGGRLAGSRVKNSGSEKVFWKRGLFRKVPFLENLEILEILDNPQTREFRDFRVSRDSSSEKTPFVVTPFPGPEACKKEK